MFVGLIFISRVIGGSTSGFKKKNMPLFKLFIVLGLSYCSDLNVFPRPLGLNPWFSVGSTSLEGRGVF